MLFYSQRKVPLPTCTGSNRMGGLLGTVAKRLGLIATVSREAGNALIPVLARRLGLGVAALGLLMNMAQAQYFPKAEQLPGRYLGLPP